MKLSELTEEQCVSLLASADKNASFKYHDVYPTMICVYAGHPRFGKISLQIDDDGDMECSIESTGDGKFFNAVAVVGLLREWRVEGFYSPITPKVMDREGWDDVDGVFEMVGTSYSWQLEIGESIHKCSKNFKIEYWKESAPESMEDLRAIIRVFDGEPWQTSVTHISGENMSEETIEAVAEMAKVAFKTTTETDKDG